MVGVLVTDFDSVSSIIGVGDGDDVVAADVDKGDGGVCSSWRICCSKVEVVTDEGAGVGDNKAWGTGRAPDVIILVALVEVAGTGRNTGDEVAGNGDDDSSTGSSTSWECCCDCDDCDDCDCARRLAFLLATQPITKSKESKLPARVAMHMASGKWQVFGSDRTLLVYLSSIFQA